ncbi:hypothetical protein DVH24_035596 [Malus domestica]|uniref:Uncharacterized protein n=1 Tax=Malus domestica TaxID=3750 RepID=A0A498JMG4_MALDO|nr:hypothetical protein DVH24_035596 [Malus domestica]
MSMIHPSRLGLYSHGRKWAYNLIRDELLIEAESRNITNSPKSSECHSSDIEARHEWLTKKEMNNGFEDEECSKILSYVDTLMDLQLPDNGRKLTDDEKWLIDIPKDAMVNFAVAEMSRDPIVWKQTMDFKPKRLMQTGQEEVEFDIKGLETFQ